MIQKKTRLKIVDNSGGLRGNSIKIYKKKIGIIGDILILSVKKIKKKKKRFLFSTRKKVELHSLYKAIIVSMKSKFYRSDGRTLNFFENNVVLLYRDKATMVGTRILKPIVKEFRNSNFMKLLLVSIKQL